MTPPSAILDPLPARLVGADTPWIPASPVKASKPLRFFSDDRGFVELLRMQPGARMPLHRHTGEIHAYTLSGARALSSGEIVGPGDYVYEPAGTIDEWRIVGDQPMTALVVVMGAVEFLDADHAVIGRASASTQLQAYLDYCARQG